MIRRRLIATLALALTCCASTWARGELLFTRSLVIDRSANIFKTDEFNLKVDFSSSFTTPVTNSLFSDTLVTPSTAPQTFEVNPGDPEFDEVAAQLTDTLNQAMRFVMTENSSGRAEGRGYTQAQLFAKPATAPDFSGKIIDKIQLTVNQFTLVSPLPGGAQAASTGKPVQLNFAFNVFGHNVPEPSTAGLVFAAALAAVTASRIRRG